MDCILQDEKYYLRSLGEDPRRDIADIRKDFPALADDIIFPDFFNENRYFSSVFRIASKGVRLWTHYDVSELICEYEHLQYHINILFYLIFPSMQNGT